MTSDSRPAASPVLRRAAWTALVGAFAWLGAADAHAASVFLNGVKIDGVTNQKFENCTVELDAQGNVQIKAKGYQVQVAPSAPATPAPAAPVAQPAAPAYAPQGYAPPAAQPYAPAQPAPQGYAPQGYAPPQQGYPPGYAQPQYAPPQAPAQPAAPAPTGPITRRYFMVTEMAAQGMAQYEVDIFINSVWVRKVTDDQEQQVFEVTRWLRPGRNVVHFTATKGAAGRRSNNPAHHFKIVFGEGNVGGDNVMIDNPLIQYRRNAGETQNFNDDFVINAR